MFIELTAHHCSQRIPSPRKLPLNKKPAWRFYFFLSGTAQEITNLRNEGCRIRPTLVAIDHPSYRRYPYYVTLYRCGGTVSFISPRFKTCVPKTAQDIKIRATNLETGEPVVIDEKNHTSCKDGCTNSKAMCDTEMEYWHEEKCRCECKYPNGPPTPCPARFKWVIQLLIF